MSYIVTDYKNIDSINLLCDGLIINSMEYSCFPENKYSKENILDIINIIKKNDKLTILNCDKIIHEYELGDFKEYINNYIDFIDYLIYSDKCVLKMVDSKYYEKLVYDSKTLVCSYNELNNIETKSFVSSELSYDELSEIVYKVDNNKLCINAFGYHQIMYSRRPLISLYNKHLGEELLSKNTIYDLKEELRDDFYKITENDQGTFIYTPFIYALLENVSIIKNKVFMFRINSFLLTYSDVEFICNCYNELLKGKNEEVIKNIEDHFSNVKPGFLKDELYLLKQKNNK